MTERPPDVSELHREGHDLGDILAGAPPVQLPAVRERVEQRGRGRKRGPAAPVDAPQAASAVPARLDLDAEAREWGDAWPWRRRGPHPDVQRLLACTEAGFPKPTLANASLVFRFDPRWSSLRMNLLGDVVELEGAPQSDEVAFVTNAVLWLAQNYGMQLAYGPAEQALAGTARQRGYHPVVEYLRGLQWDGEPRIRRLLPEVLGVRDNPLQQRFVRRFLISAVARTLDPGCKVDTALVLVGRQQGRKKSTFFEVLAGKAWYGRSPLPIGNKDAYLQLRASWIYEAAEMESMSRATAEAVKQFLDTSEDLFRGLFERSARRRPRHCVLCGTTNQEEYLTDPTGSRRFWTIAVPEGWTIRVELLAAWRDQLWAEALAAYGVRERWWFEPDEDVERARNAEAFTEADPWEELVRAWAIGRTWVRVDEVWAEPLKGTPDRLGTREQRRIADILRRMGYERGTKRTVVGGVTRGWGKGGEAQDTA